LIKKVPNLEEKSVIDEKALLKMKKKKKKHAKNKETHEEGL